MFVEVIYETGAKSVAEYADEQEALAALEAQHSKATTGEAGGPFGGPAERIKKVLTYDEHPATLGEGNLISVTDAKTHLSAKIDELAVGDQVSNMELAAAIRDMSNPLTAEEGPFNSQFKMQETGELTGSWS